MNKMRDAVTLEIPIFKTACGESIRGRFSFSYYYVFLELSFEGSQLLRYVVEKIIHIVDNRRYKYFLYLDLIFWRINKLDIKNNRKNMVIEILSYIKHFVLQNCQCGDNDIFTDCAAI